MLIEAVVAVALMGQAEVCEPIVYWEMAQPQYVQLVPTVEYWFGTWSKETEFQGEIYYGTELRRVPIINGFAPEIHKIDGRTIYDYRKQIAYSRCLKRDQHSGIKPVRPPKVIKDLEAMKAPFYEPEKQSLPVRNNDYLRRPSDVGDRPSRQIRPTYNGS